MTPLDKLREAVITLPEGVPVTLTWRDADWLLAHIEALEAAREARRPAKRAPVLRLLPGGVA